MREVTTSPRRLSWRTTARAEAGNGKFPTQGYSTQRNASRPQRKRMLSARTARGWMPVAEVVEQGGACILRKQVHSQKHRLHKPPGYALEESVIIEAEALDVTLVELTERDTGRVLRAALRAFRDYGLRIERGGFAPQWVLPIERWSTGNAVQLKLIGA